MNRQTNRKAGSFKAVARRVRDAELDQLDDNRSRHGRRFKWSALLNALVLGACVAARTLRAVETLTMDVAQTVRRATGIRCRISDTKLRDTLLSLEPQQLRAALHRLVKAEQRRGHLTPKRFPFGVVAIDGKCLGKLDRWDYADIQPVRPAGAKWYGLARVLRAHLVSANATVCIDECPIPGSTNEMGTVCGFVEDMLSTYRHTAPQARLVGRALTN